MYDNNAYTITSIYRGSYLKLYTIHPINPSEPGGHPEYYLNQLNSWSLAGNRETCSEGFPAYRNGKDLAKEWRDEFIKAANRRATDP
jgi:hypothetical protein